MLLPKPFFFIVVYFPSSLSTPLLSPCRSGDGVHALADG